MQFFLSVLFVIGTSSYVNGLLNFNNNRVGTPLFGNILNNNNGIRNTFMMGLVRGKNSQCRATGNAQTGTDGICKPMTECKKLGGMGSGVCALVGVCCVVGNTCGNTTRSKISYFNSPNIFQPECGLNIQLYSPNVCQIRLDFERFQLEGPAEGIVTHNCINDSFIVTGAGNLGIPSLCGNNDGQHIYIPVNASQGSSIMLDFLLADPRVNLVNPNWRIKITQLECGNSNLDFSSFQSTLTTMYQKHKNKKNNARNDQALIAPPGCLQYYPNASGTYESFNYNNGNGPQIAGLDYAICFNRRASTCGIRHTADTFNLNRFDCDLLTPPPAICPACHTPPNWLLIPGSQMGANGDDYYCGADLVPGTPVTSTGSGPLYVGVRTEDPVNAVGPTPANNGFRINYAVQSTCPTPAPPAAG